MSITIIPLGLLKTFLKGSERLVIQGKEGKSVEAVCKEIGLPTHLDTVFIINKEIKNKDYLLQPDDEVKVLALISGG
jgi:molybdopterin converting factor small subunit